MNSELEHDSPVTPVITTGIVTVLVVGFISVVGGMVILIVTDHDVTGYVLSIGMLFTSIGGFWQILRAQKKQSGQIEAVRRQTNGNLHRLEQKNITTEGKLMAALSALPPDDAQRILEDTLSAEEMRNIRNAAQGVNHE